METNLSLPISHFHPGRFTDTEILHRYEIKGLAQDQLQELATGRSKKEFVEPSKGEKDV